MTKTMYDAAYPPSSPPNMDVVAFYIGGDTPHVWTAAELDKQKAKYRLPIWVRSNPKNASQGTEEGKTVAAWLKAHKVPTGCAVCLDFETAVNGGYVSAFDKEIMAGGWKTVLYGSQSFVVKNPKPSGGYWGAHWTGSSHIAAGDVATQWADDKMIGHPWDVSTVNDSLKLWDRLASPTPTSPPTISGADKIISVANGEVGTVEHSDGTSKYGDWYADKVKNSAFRTGDWCDMFVSWCADKAGESAAVGLYAYVPSHMNHFKSLGVWHSGHSGIRKGDVIFFDFNGNGTPDHIGLVRFADNDGVHTTEGNTSNAVKERVRTTGILGYGRPKYKGGSVPTPPPSGSTWLDKVMASLPDVKNGDSGANVETVQGLCNARMTTGQTLLKIDGDFGSKTETAVKSVQAHYKLTTDGVVGEHTWTVLITAKG